MSQSIGSAAKTLGTTPDTLRYYEKLHLFPPPGRNAAGRRIYREEDLGRLRFLKRAQALGFSLADIRKLLHLRDSPTRSSRAVRELAQRKRDQLEVKMREVEQMYVELSHLLALCTGSGMCCPILGRMDRGKIASADATSASE